MADINVEQRGPTIWPWIIGLTVAALLIWALAGLFDGGEEVAMEPATEEVLVEPAAEVQPPTLEPSAEVAPAAGIPLAQIIESPATWTGRTLSGEVRVAEVPTDRGFWIEDQGERVFAILKDRPAEQPKDINPGQTLRVTEAKVYQNLADVPGQIDADTRRIAEGQAVVLVVDESNIEILSPAGGS